MTNDLLNTSDVVIKSFKKGIEIGGKAAVEYEYSFVSKGIGQSGAVVNIKDGKDTYLIMLIYGTDKKVFTNINPIK